MNFKSAISNLKGWLALLCLCCLMTAAQTPAAKINLNTATAAQLETLPGIGPGLAQRILAYRAKHGAFKRPQDILILRGMSVKRYRLLAPYLTA